MSAKKEALLLDCLHANAPHLQRDTILYRRFCFHRYIGQVTLSIIYFIV